MIPPFYVWPEEHYASKLLHRWHRSSSFVLFAVHLLLKHCFVCQDCVIDSDSKPLTTFLWTVMVCYYKFMRNTASADVVVFEGSWLAADKMTFIIVQAVAVTILADSCPIVGFEQYFPTSCLLQIKVLYSWTNSGQNTLNKLLLGALNTRVWNGCYASGRCNYRC